MHRGRAVASTGPRSEERGDRKSLPAVVRDGFASTGPRSEERGDGQGAPQVSSNAKLQRGRAPKSAEILSSPSPLPVATGRFNGAALRRARRYSAGEFIRWLPKPASTGPRSEERGDIDRAEAHLPHCRASTGPRSEERGDYPAREIHFSRYLLQRGRAPKSAEID